MAQRCMAPTVHCTDGTTLYGTNSAPYRWHKCMAPVMHRAHSTAVYGTNSAPYSWHSSVWHHQCTVQITQQCMALTVHRTDGTNSVQCYGVTIRTAVFRCF